MRCLSLVLLFLVGPLVAAPLPAAAQTLVDPTPRQGYFASLSMQGTAQLNTDESLGTLPVWPGGGGSLRLGQALDERFALGLFMDFTMASGKRREGIGSGLGVELSLLLGERWLVGAGVGLGFARLTDAQDSEADALGGYGARVRLSAQRDWFPWTAAFGGGWALSPVVTVELLPADGFRSLGLSLGLQGTFWGGLERNRLRLPVEQAYERRED